MKRQELFQAVMLAVLPVICACGILKVRDRDEASVQGIKKVAVVAFAVTQPAPAKLGLNLNSGKLGATAGGSMLSQESAHVDKLYEDFKKTFGKNTGWKVLETDKMKVHAGYRAAYKSTMEGWQNKMPPGEGLNVYVIHEIMDQDALRILGPEGRENLMKALDVDAIVTAQVRGGLEGTTVMGVGSRYPKANVAFEVYSKGKERAVWFDGRVEGNVSSESVGGTGFFDETVLNEEISKSALTAFAKIGDTKVQ